MRVTVRVILVFPALRPENPARRERGSRFGVIANPSLRLPFPCHFIPGDMPATRHFALGCAVPTDRPRYRSFGPICAAIEAQLISLYVWPNLP